MAFKADLPQQWQRSSEAMAASYKILDAGPDAESATRLANVTTETTTARLGDLVTDVFYNYVIGPSGPIEMTRARKRYVPTSVTSLIEDPIAFYKGYDIEIDLDPSRHGKVIQHYGQRGITNHPGIECIHYDNEIWYYKFRTRPGHNLYCVMFVDDIGNEITMMKQLHPEAFD